MRTASYRTGGRSVRTPLRERHVTGFFCPGPVGSFRFWPPAGEWHDEAGAPRADVLAHVDNDPCTCASGSGRVSRLIGQHGRWSSCHGRDLRAVRQAVEGSGAALARRGRGANTALYPRDPRVFPARVTHFTRGADTFSPPVRRTFPVYPGFESGVLAACHAGKVRSFCGQSAVFARGKCGIQVV